MENKLLRLCNKIHKSHFNLVEVIIILEKDSCTLCCLNRDHTVFLEMDVDLDYFQGKYNVSNTGIYFVRPENIIAQSLDLKKEYKLSEFERVHLLSIQRCHHFFHEDHHETSFNEFKNIAQSEFGNVLIQCNGFQSVFSSLYLNEPLLDIPDTFSLNLPGNEKPLSMRYTYDFFTVKAAVASKLIPSNEAQIVFEVD